MIHIYIILFHILFPYSYRTLRWFLVLYSRSLLVIYFVYTSVYMLIPNSSKGYYSFHGNNITQDLSLKLFCLSGIRPKSFSWLSFLSFSSLLNPFFSQFVSPADIQMLKMDSHSISSSFCAIFSYQGLGFPIFNVGVSFGTSLVVQ